VPSPVDAFAVDVADVTDPEGSSNWRGKAVQATVRSRDGLEPPFLIRIFSVGANVTNDGKVALTSLASLLGWMNDDGRRKLQGAT
jgi:hypothetical protein